MTVTEHRAFPINARLYRQRPWLSDGVWLAHESLPLFSILAGKMTSNGSWLMLQSGLTMEGHAAPDLAGLIERSAHASAPCTVLRAPEITAPSFDDLTEEQVHGQHLEVIDEHGARWLFNAAIADTAPIGQRTWGWRIAPGTEGAQLVGIDRKDRPRFLLCSLWKEPW